MNIASVIELISALRSNPVSESYFEEYSLLLRLLTRGDHCLLLSLDEGGHFELLTASPQAPDWLVQQSHELVKKYGDRLLSQEGAASIQRSDPEGSMRVVVAQRLSMKPTRLAVFNIPARESANLNELLLRVQLVADLAVVPDSVALIPAESSPTPVQPELYDVLALTTEVMSQTHFGSAVVMLVNGLGANLGSSLVALGWNVRGTMRIMAISHISRFEQKTEQTRLLQSACEEAFDLERRLSYPDQSDLDGVLFGHRQLKQSIGADRVISIPLRSIEGAPLAVLLIAQEDLPVSEANLDAIQIGAGLLMPWLEGRRRKDRWWGPRLLEWSGKLLGKLLGPDNLWQKMAALMMAAGLLYISMVTWPFRLEAVGQMVTDQTRQFSSPFDGYVDQVHVTIGDEVEAGGVLAQLDVKDLLLQEAEIRAEIRRLKADEDKARAQNGLIDVEIAEARLAQSSARLKRVLQQRSQADIRAPFSGIIVEGERKTLLGAPVRKGDELFRLARIEGLYGQLELPETLIRFLPSEAQGELSLLAKPDQRIPFHVTSVVPLAQVKGQQGNHFIVKVTFTQQPEKWWRPGMSGIAKIDAGERPLIWLWTYRLVDNLRMRLWW